MGCKVLDVGQGVVGAAVGGRVWCGLEDGDVWTIKIKPCLKYNSLIIIISSYLYFPPRI